MKITENQLTVRNARLPMVEIETTLTMQKRKGELPVPEALYSCGCKGCAEQVSYPADMLWWSERRKNWHCDSCWWEFQSCEEKPEEKGISLKDYLEAMK
jgi:hypothetical protein